MADPKRGWKQFQKLTFDSKKFSKSVKKAESVTVRHARRFIVGRLDNIRSVRRHIIGWLLLVGVLILAVGLQLTWFQQSYQATAATDGGTYAEATLGPVDTLNPLYAVSSAEISTSRLMFSSLYSYDTTGHLSDDLASSYESNEDGTVYTVKLHSDVRWHDGHRLTADDVAFTVDLIKDPATRTSLQTSWQDIQVEALDDTTVQFTLPATYAAFPHALTFAILPEHILGEVTPGSVRESDFSRSPVGSGPFSFRMLGSADEEQTHRIIQMSAFDQYHKGRTLIDRFEIHAYETQDSIMRALKTGEVTAASDLSGANASQVDKANYDVMSEPINRGVYALFNLDNEILKNDDVRRALQLATDPAAIRSSMAITPPALNSPFVRGQLEGKNLPSQPASDLDSAIKILDDAKWKLVDGVRQKGDQKLSLTITTTKNSQYQKTLEVLAGQWRRLGVAVDTNIVDTRDPSANFVQNTLQARNYDVLLYELAIGADPDVYAYWHSSQAGMDGRNFSNYDNKVADAALSSARSRIEPELRNIKYISFAKQWVDDVPAIGLYQSTAEYVVNNSVQSVDSSNNLISAYDRYSDILYWSVNQESVYKTP